VKYAFNYAHATTWRVTSMCRVLEVWRAGYYKWRAEPFGPVAPLGPRDTVCEQRVSARAARWRARRQYESQGRLLGQCGGGEFPRDAHEGTARRWTVRNAACGLRAPAWTAWAAWVRRWVRIWSITDACVMRATNPHGAVAGRAREWVDLEDLLEEGRPAASGFGRRESWRGDDRGRRISGGGQGRPSHPPRAVGIPAVVPGW